MKKYLKTNWYKLLPVTFVFIGLSALLSGCSGISSKIDPKILENSDEAKKIHAELLKNMGKQASKVDEVSIIITNPADKGEKGNAILLLTADVQDPDNPKQLVRKMFNGYVGGWQPEEQVTIDVSGSDEEKANFRLENQLFDFQTKVTADKFDKIIHAAYDKGNADAKKFAYRYVNMVKINIEGYRIFVQSKLEANDQMISDNYMYDFDGNLIE